jgi:periplasmic divalent cation tolerance protein
MTDKVVVLVTCGSTREARRIARALVHRRLAACASIVTAPVRSTYRWKGKVQTAREVLTMVKTTRKRLPDTVKMVQSLHSYDVPEIIALPIVAASAEYLAWISECVRPSKRG